MYQDETDLYREKWDKYIAHLGKVDLNLLNYRPDFMVISSARTGSTWLTHNLSRHGQIFIPEVKELRFFNTFWRVCNINWYLKQFKIFPDLKKGEATPSYMRLPLRVIKLISLLMPELKLIFIMRDPLSRIWSHVKLNYRVRMNNNEEDRKDFDSITDEEWFARIYRVRSILGYSDYLGSLQRWLMFFPKEQFYIGFYESITWEPKRLISDIFDFLEVKKEVDWEKFLIKEKINKGIEKKMPPGIEARLRFMYSKRTEELADFLKNEFNLKIPEEWNYSIEGKKINDPLLLEKNFPVENKERRLIDLLFDFEDEIILKEILTVEENYKGFNLIFYTYKYYAFALSLGSLDIRRLGEERLKEFHTKGLCFTSDNLEDLKKKVDNQSDSPCEVYE